MANAEQLATLLEGSLTWNEWRRRNPDLKIDLRGASLMNPALCRTNLSDADLQGADVSHADLSEADLRRANVSRSDVRGAILCRAVLREVNLANANCSEADFREADLHEANLQDADLDSADLSRTNLDDANLSRAKLTRANFSDASLIGAKLERSVLGWTTLNNSDLTDATGLESVQQQGPSSLGIDTFFRSSGLPQVFQRGAGVPEMFITYSESLVGRTIQFYSCFISYSTKDQDFAERLQADLQAKGVRCWFAPHDMIPGRKMHEQIDEAIRLYDKLLLILSPSSMSSEWVKTEIAKARKREVRDTVRVLFPISLVAFEAIRDWECFDADTGKDSAREIREYFIPNFSSWKTDHETYLQSLGRLVDSLGSKTIV